jgi:4-diphosphocytidyl-2-C-methyl-D-erythritol kinase
MTVIVPSFAKINLGLRIGALRPDGFHELRTVYQTIALHDVVRVSVGRGSGVEIQCDDRRVPRDSTNTCSGIVERAMAALKARGRVVIEIEKRLPVQGGLGGASGNAVAALLALERAMHKQLSGAEKLRVAAEVGSDLPLFLIAGTVLGMGRGEEVYPLPDLGLTACVVALPEIAVSTPEAFAEWDSLCDSRIQPDEGKMGKGTAFSRAEASPPIFCHSEPALAGEETAVRRGKQVAIRLLPFGQSLRAGSRLRRSSASGRSSSLGTTGALGRERDELAEQSSAWTGEGAGPHVGSGGAQSSTAKLTHPHASDRMAEFSREISAWLSAASERAGRRSGVSAKGGGRAENPLLDLVRTGIENDFERVVFPQYPELREVKSVLERAGARYASLSGSGSAVYGLFESRQKAADAATRLKKSGISAVVTSTLTRRQYWKRLLALGS